MLEFAHLAWPFLDNPPRLFGRDLATWAQRGIERAVQLFGDKNVWAREEGENTLSQDRQMLSTRVQWKYRR
jgi:hypothetical protein